MTNAQLFLVTTIVSEIFSGYHYSFFCTFVSSFLFFVFWSVSLFCFLIEKCGIVSKKREKNRVLAASSVAQVGFNDDF